MFKFVKYRLGLKWSVLFMISIVFASCRKEVLPLEVTPTPITVEPDCTIPAEEIKVFSESQRAFVNQIPHQNLAYVNPNGDTIPLEFLYFHDTIEEKCAISKYERVSMSFHGKGGFNYEHVNPQLIDHNIYHSLQYYFKNGDSILNQ